MVLVTGCVGLWSRRRCGSIMSTEVESPSVPAPRKGGCSVSSSEVFVLLVSEVFFSQGSLLRCWFLRGSERGGGSFGKAWYDLLVWGFVSQWWCSLGLLVMRLL